MTAANPLTFMPSSGDTILIVGHGSREDSGNQEIREFTEQWRAQRPDWRIELCFIVFDHERFDSFDRGVGPDRTAYGRDRTENPTRQSPQW